MWRCGASKKVRRPIKWTGDRSGGLPDDAHGRDHLTKAEFGVRRRQQDHRAAREDYANLGAYMSLFSFLGADLSLCDAAVGPYNIPNIFAEVISVYTNTTPVDAYRGAGRPKQVSWWNG